MKTFFMVKPDGVKRNIVGQVIDRVEQEGFKISKMKMMTISSELAAEQNGEHKDKPFFSELTEFMSSGKCVVIALKKEDAVNKWRELIGATDPAEADEGTIRKDYASSLGENAVHGADSNENAAREIGFFFSDTEIIANH